MHCKSVGSVTGVGLGATEGASVGASVITSTGLSLEGAREGLSAGM